ncbi:MAG TPA: cyclase family protein [Xanthobacteraceae bacterium]|nr:cyclase family protein [Xanthobacteraceae bacterium]
MCVPGCQEIVQQSLSRRGFLRSAAAAGFAATAVSTAEAAPRQFRRVVDLTHTMSREFPTYFGEPGIEMEKKFDFKKDGFNLNLWKLNEHAGTHMDAPIHFTENGATVDRLAPEALVVPLVVINVAARAEENMDYLLSREDLRDWERKHGRLPPNCCVAMYSGWARHVDSPEKYTGKDANGVLHFPGFSPLAAEWLIKERKVAGIAVDTLSLDNGPSKDFQTHKLWLSTGRWGLENVANLDKVPAAGATLVVGLAKVKDATGGPTRLLALI